MSKVTRKQRQVAHFMTLHQPPPHGKWAPRQRDRCIHAVLPWRPAPCPLPFLGPSSLVGAGVGSRVSEGKGLAQGTGNSLWGLPHMCIGPRSPARLCRPTLDPVPCFCPGLPTSDVPQRPVGLWTPSQSCCFSAESPALIWRKSQMLLGCSSVAPWPRPLHPMIPTSLHSSPGCTLWHRGLPLTEASMSCLRFSPCISQVSFPSPSGLCINTLTSPGRPSPPPHLLWSPHAFAT